MRGYIDFYIFLRYFYVIWPILDLFCPFLNKMASEKSPDFRVNSNDANLTRRQRTRHAEALGKIFHFDIDILCFAFVLVWRAEDKTFQLARSPSHRAQEKNTPCG